MSVVSVIVPCYKYAHYLRGCVESVLSQDGVDVRVLVIDDASPDETPSVAGQLIAEDGRVEYRRHPTNRGHIATYNEGLEWAAGEYVLLLSADDWLAPGALSRAARLMEAHPEVGLTCGGAVLVRPSESIMRGVLPQIVGEWTILSGQQFLELACRGVYNPVWTPTAVARTSVQKKVGFYSKELPHTADLEMWLRFGVHGSVGVINACQAYYRQHGENMSVYYSERKLRDMRQRLGAFEAVSQKHAPAVAELRELGEQVHRTIAEEAYWEAQHAFDRGETESCREYLAFARTTYKDIAKWPTWSRMRWKLMMGPQVWGAVEQVCNLVVKR